MSKREVGASGRFQVAVRKVVTENKAAKAFAAFHRRLSEDATPQAAAAQDEGADRVDEFFSKKKLSDFQQKLIKAINLNASGSIRTEATIAAQRNAKSKPQKAKDLKSAVVKIYKYLKSIDHGSEEIDLQLALNVLKVESEDAGVKAKLLELLADNGHKKITGVDKADFEAAMCLMLDEEEAFHEASSRVFQEKRQRSSEELEVFFQGNEQAAFIEEHFEDFRQVLQTFQKKPFFGRAKEVEITDLPKILKKRELKPDEKTGFTDESTRSLTFFDYSKAEDVGEIKKLLVLAVISDGGENGHFKFLKNQFQRAKAYKEMQQHFASHYDEDGDVESASSSQAASAEIDFFNKFFRQTEVLVTSAQPRFGRSKPIYAWADAGSEAIPMQNLSGFAKIFSELSQGVAANKIAESLKTDEVSQLIAALMMSGNDFQKNTEKRKQFIAAAALYPYLEGFEVDKANEVSAKLIQVLAAERQAKAPFRESAFFGGDEAPLVLQNFGQLQQRDLTAFLALFDEGAELFDLKLEVEGKLNEIRASLSVEQELDDEKISAAGGAAAGKRVVDLKALVNSIVSLQAPRLAHNALTVEDIDDEYLNVAPIEGEAPGMAESESSTLPAAGVATGVYDNLPGQDLPSLTSLRAEFALQMEQFMKGDKAPVAASHYEVIDNPLQTDSAYAEAVLLQERDVDAEVDDLVKMQPKIAALALCFASQKELEQVQARLLQVERAKKMKDWLPDILQEKPEVKNALAERLGLNGQSQDKAILNAATLQALDTSGYLAVGDEAEEDKSPLGQIVDGILSGNKPSPEQLAALPADRAKDDREQRAKGGKRSQASAASEALDSGEDESATSGLRRRGSNSSTSSSGSEGSGEEDSESLGGYLDLPSDEDDERGGEDDGYLHVSAANEDLIGVLEELKAQNPNLFATLNKRMQPTYDLAAAGSQDGGQQSAEEVLANELLKKIPSQTRIDGEGEQFGINQLRVAAEAALSANTNDGDLKLLKDLQQFLNDLELESVELDAEENGYLQVVGNIPEGESGGVQVSAALGYLQERNRDLFNAAFLPAENPSGGLYDIDGGATDDSRVKAAVAVILRDADGDESETDLSTKLTKALLRRAKEAKLTLARKKETEFTTFLEAELQKVITKNAVAVNAATYWDDFSGLLGNETNVGKSPNEDAKEIAQYYLRNKSNPIYDQGGTATERAAESAEILQQRLSELGDNNKGKKKQLMHATLILAVANRDQDFVQAVCAQALEMIEQEKARLQQENAEKWIEEILDYAVTDGDLKPLLDEINRQHSAALTDAEGAHITALEAVVNQVHQYQKKIKRLREGKKSIVSEVSGDEYLGFGLAVEEMTLENFQAQLQALKVKAQESSTDGEEATLAAAATAVKDAVVKVSPESAAMAVDLAADNSNLADITNLCCKTIVSAMVSGDEELGRVAFNTLKENLQTKQGREDVDWVVKFLNQEVVTLKLTEQLYRKSQEVASQIGAYELTAGDNPRQDYVGGIISNIGSYQRALKTKGDREKVASSNLSIEEIQAKFDSISAPDFAGNKEEELHTVLNLCLLNSHKARTQALADLVLGEILSPEQEAARRAAEEAARLAAEQARLAAEAARTAAEEEAARRAAEEEAARRAAQEEVARKAAEQEAARIAMELAARRAALGITRAPVKPASPPAPASSSAAGAATNAILEAKRKAYKPLNPLNSTDKDLLSGKFDVSKFSYQILTYSQNKKLELDFEKLLKDSFPKAKMADAVASVKAQMLQITGAGLQDRLMRDVGTLDDSGMSNPKKYLGAVLTKAIQNCKTTGIVAANSVQKASAAASRQAGIP